MSRLVTSVLLAGLVAVPAAPAASAATHVAFTPTSASVYPFVSVSTTSPVSAPVSRTRRTMTTAQVTRTGKPAATAAAKPTTGTSRTTTGKPTPPAASGTTTLRPGSRGTAVTALQTSLNRRGYWVGTPTGRYGHSTTQAVMALQKVAGLGRDGIAGPATMRALNRGVTPTPRSRRGRVVEIDLARQILMLVVDGRPRFIVNTSTGTPATPTPRGTYRLYRRVDGWHAAPLGKLYRPMYFTGGYAVHGVRDGNIPGHPASHGCARVSMAAMDMMWARGGIRIGDTVRVH